ncbi:PR domain zinc finger protein 14-like [Paramacrobiotus metropolitanus]|uniref:PR domain zinc finger protein 14-like n=1 Tax=Paramacrobiotus metropolitanus TaxID=2943436 RepID=UPI002445CE8D|nr:PR domain zinc finger protein 14-like [Paramacrobiotus metropolitanus]
MRLEHPQEMKQLGKHSDFLCAECGYTFKLKANYTTHMKKVHPQFQCWYCARILYSTEEFNAHTAEHAVDGVYPCSSCTATFPTYDASSEHFHECHDVANMKVCEVCLVVCGGQQKLAEHMQREHGQGSGRKRKRVRKSAPKSGGENGSMPV